MLYVRKPDPKKYGNRIEINTVSILTVVVGLLVSFVIPVQLIELGKQQPNTEAVYASDQTQGRVAGASDADVGNLITSGIQDLLDNNQLLIIVGISLIVISATALIFLLRTAANTAKNESQT